MRNRFLRRACLPSRRGFTRLRSAELRRACLSGRQGFTLIEMLIIIGIIAVLASVIILAVNPNKHLGNSRDTKRASDVNTILSAVYQYMIDHNGAVPDGITSTPKWICVTDSVCQTGTGVDLDILTGSYLVELPRDPNRFTSNNTYYQIVRDATTNRITVSAPGVEIPERIISVTR